MCIRDSFTTTCLAPRFRMIRAASFMSARVAIRIPERTSASGMFGVRTKASGMSSVIMELIPLAFVLTPNIPEAEVLSGIRIATLADMKEAARIIRNLGARHVVVKGGHLAGDATDLLY